MASASTSTAVNSCNEIFLNHRGPDTKNTFTSYLHRRLVLHGFRVFWDKEEMQVGDSLTSQIHEAIKAASLHVAIFSPGYAESKWCLEELVLMLESKKPIIPVFYGVHPTDVRQTQDDGVFAQALRNLEKKTTYDSQPRHTYGVFAQALGCLQKKRRHRKPRYNSTAIENWRTALSTVAEISGLELDKFSGDEGELLDKVIDSVLKKMGKTRFDVAEHPTGLDEKIEDFEEKVLSVQREHTGKPQVIGIVGFGGIGKTTLVKELFNRKSSQYRKSCILFDVRENARKASLESLQKKFLKGLTQIDQNIKSVSEGIQLLKTHLSSCDALVILDDVDHINQLDALLRPIRDVLHPHSLILITSRDKGVLKSSKVEESSIYKLTSLNTQHSQQLFCLHAFSQGHPLPGFEDLVHSYLKACDGLPLSLKVFGALLYENDISFWQDQLDRLQEILPEDIEKSLLISYDALQRDEKQIFLDVACFFIGKNRDTAIRIWDGSGWKGSLGFRSLHNKNLVEVDIENNIRMHDHLRDLGRDLAKNPELPRRIWRTEDFEDLLQQSSETDVRGISIRWTKTEHPSFARCRIRNLQLLDFNASYLLEHPLESIRNAMQSPNLIWFSSDHSSPPSWIPLKKLRVLELRGRKLRTLWEEESEAPLQLRELIVPDCAITSLPHSFGNLTNLEHIVLRCIHLEILPDSFGNLTRLQHLELRGCYKLESITLRNLTRLKYLHLHELRGCYKLRSITLGTICTLEHVRLSRCESIEVLPAQLARQQSLEVLDLQYLYNLRELPSDIGELKKLKHLRLERCERLESLPVSLGRLNQLTRLTIHDCSRLREVSFKMVEGERESICPNLQHLTIMYCNGLVEVGTLPDALTTLKLIGCRELRKIEWSSPLSKLQMLNISDCTEVEQLPSLETLVSLEELHTSWCSRLIRGVAHLPKLRTINVRWCYSLESLPDSLGRLNQLTNLTIRDCYPLREVSFKMVEGERESICPNLQHLQISDCWGLVEVGTLPDALTTLTVSECAELRKIEWSSPLSKLQRLNINDCREVEQLPSLETLVSLEELDTSGCSRLRIIRGVAHLPKLRRSCRC